MSRWTLLRIQRHKLARKQAAKLALARLLKEAGAL